MSKKQKGRKTDWTECVKCKLIVSDRDVNIHREQCGVQSCSHGFVKDCILHGVISPFLASAGGLNEWNKNVEELQNGGK